MAIDTKFRDGAPTADDDGVLLLDEVAMMIYDAMDFASGTGSIRGSRLQAGGTCLVVKLASLVVSCGGHRPPTNATNQCFDWKATRATRLVYTCPQHLYMRHLDPTGLHEKSTRWESNFTTWTHNISSWYAVITETSPVVC